MDFDEPGNEGSAHAPGDLGLIGDVVVQGEVVGLFEPKARMRGGVAEWRRERSRGRTKRYGSQQNAESSLIRGCKLLSVHVGGEYGSAQGRNAISGQRSHSEVGVRFHGQFPNPKQSVR